MPGPVKRRNIFLTGMMGSGKSTVARVVAEHAGLQFVDTDVWIEQKQNMSVSEIFQIKGEPFFREQEKFTLKNLVSNENQVVATGGGMLADADTLRLAAKSGLVIYLAASIPTLEGRLMKQTDRPLLEGRSLTTRLEQIYVLRRPIYDSIQHRINTDDLSISQIAESVTKLFKHWLTQ